jgi:hypothetical protein
MPPSAKHGDVLSKPHGGNARNRTPLAAVTSQPFPKVKSGQNL